MNPYTFITFCFVVLFHQLHAQNSIQIHNNASLSNFGQLSVFGDLTQEGEYYSADSNAYLFFFGTYWQNDPLAQNTGSGGVHFKQPNPLYGSSSLQNIDAGGYDAGFARLSLQNPNGLLLLANAMEIREQLHFQSGKITLDGNNLKVNDGGKIIGYDEDRFIITNGLPTDQSGFLIREGSNIALDYPIGFSSSNYNPARIENSGEQDLYSVRVFPDVYADATTGDLKNDASVGVTWEIREATAGGSDVQLSLQHDQSTVGSSFSSEKNFIAAYINPVPGGQGGTLSLDDLPNWDFPGIEQCGGNLEEDISTGNDNPQAYTNYRSALDNFIDYTYYTVYNCEYETPDAYYFPNAFSPNGDGVNDTWVVNELALFATRQLTIVNRWGDVVYSSKNYQNDWDGTMNGRNLPAGTYYYIFSLGGSTGVRKGAVTILRK